VQRGAPAFLFSLMHPSAWKVFSANFVFTAFYEVRSGLSSVATCSWWKGWAASRNARQRGGMSCTRG
jgi:hypothetical protein